MMSVDKVFVPSRGFLFFYAVYLYFANHRTCFRPLTGISLFLSKYEIVMNAVNCVFVPSRGFLFFYSQCDRSQWWPWPVFVPSRGFLFFYWRKKRQSNRRWSFRPLTGISLFLFVFSFPAVPLLQLFSSPHGDFSFSIKPANGGRRNRSKSFRPLTGISLFLWIYGLRLVGIMGFRPLTGISLFL